MKLGECDDKKCSSLGVQEVHTSEKNIVHRLIGHSVGPADAREQSSRGVLRRHVDVFRLDVPCAKGPANVQRGNDNDHDRTLLVWLLCQRKTVIRHCIDVVWGSLSHYITAPLCHDSRVTQFESPL